MISFLCLSLLLVTYFVNAAGMLETHMPHVDVSIASLLTSASASDCSMFDIECWMLFVACLTFTGPVACVCTC